MAKRTTRKKTKAGARKKATRARTSTKAPAASKARVTPAPKSKPRTKSQFISTVADAAGISKKEAAAVFDATAAVIKADLKSGPGVCNVGGLMKVLVQRKPATRARKGVNPFTGEEMMFKAKPARNVVKVRPLKSLKELV